MELPNVGAQCALSSCSQLDFLPIRCRHCSLKYCAEHFRPAVHSCTAYHSGPIGAAAACPVCDRSIEFGEGDDPNAAVAAHMESPACVARKKGNPHCSVPKCKARGGGLVCKRCRQILCVEHRRGDHDCTPPAAVAAMSRAREAEAAAAARAQPPVQAPPAPAPARVAAVAPPAPRRAVEAAAPMELATPPRSSASQSSSSSSSSSLNIMSLERIRAEAIGDPAIPPESRLYFYVFYPVETSLPFGTPVFVSSAWTLADAAAFVAGTIGLADEAASMALYDARTGAAPVDDLPLEFLASHLRSGTALLLERRSHARSVDGEARLVPDVFTQHGLAVPVLAH